MPALLLGGKSNSTVLEAKISRKAAAAELATTCRRLGQDTFGKKRHRSLYQTEENKKMFMALCL